MKKIVQWILGFGLFVVLFPINACIVTVSNDGNKTILLVSEDNQLATVIKAHTTENFGSDKGHARFYVMKKNSQHNYDACYFVGQHSCSVNKNTLSFSLSDIENNKVNPNFFKVSQFNKSLTTIKGN